MSPLSTIATLGLALTSLISSALLAPIASAAGESSQPLVRKLDPQNQVFIPVQPAEVIPGKIYSHYDQQSGQYLWAFALEGGTFSFPLGPGTTELPSNFDLATTESQTQDLLESAVGGWAKISASEGRPLLVRLQATGTWEVLQMGSVRSHFDASTGRRWQWSGSRKVAIDHAGGPTWKYEGDWYVPANPWLSSASIHGFRCGCEVCDR